MGKGRLTVCWERSRSVCSRGRLQFKKDQKDRRVLWGLESPVSVRVPLSLLHSHKRMETFWRERPGSSGTSLGSHCVTLGRSLSFSGSGGFGSGPEPPVGRVEAGFSPAAPGAPPVCTAPLGFGAGGTGARCGSVTCSKSHQS